MLEETRRSALRPLVPFILSCLCSSAIGCGGTSGIIASLVSSGSRSGSNAATPTVRSLQVQRTRKSPAEISFELVDSLSRPVNVRLTYIDDLARIEIEERFLVASSAMGCETTTTLAQLSTSPDGNPFKLMWDFEAQLGPGTRRSGMLLIALVDSGGTQVATDVVEIVTLGNTPPNISEIEVPVEGNMEFVGPFMVIPFMVQDSESDVVDITVEFERIGDGGKGFQRAFAVTDGADPPPFTFGGVRADQGGVRLFFAWDLTREPADGEFEARLRFRAEETDVEEELDGIFEIETNRFKIDNNAPPVPQIDSESFVSSPDRRRGVPIPFSLTDAENDTITTFFQWRFATQTEFASLPDDPSELRSLLSNPTQVRRLQIALERPTSYRGRISGQVTSRTLRAEVLANSASTLLRHPGILSRTIELLRTANRFDDISVAFPVGAVPIGDHTIAAVLTRPEGAPWRLQVINLATGQVQRDVAESPDPNAEATALEPESGDESFLIASHSAGAWSLFRVRLQAEDPILLVEGSGDPIHDLESLGSDSCLAAQEHSILALRYTEQETASLIGNLIPPTAIALDPVEIHRLYVVDNGLEGPVPGRLQVIDLKTLERRKIADGSTLPRPMTMTLDNDGLHLIAVTDEDPNDMNMELRNVILRGPDEGSVSLIDGNLDRSGSFLASGSDSLLILSQKDRDKMRIAGGVEQSRGIAAYDGNTQEILVETDFTPVPRPGQGFRIRDAIRSSRVGPTGATDVFTWDSEETRRGGDVLFRAVSFDADISISESTSTPRQVLSPFAESPRSLGQLASTNGPRAVRFADINRDGRLDVVSANQRNDSLSIFYQEEDGSFASNPQFVGNANTSDGPSAVLVADINGDGLPDLVSANEAGDDITVFAQTKAGIFMTFAQFDGSRAIVDPSAVVAADLTGDGRLDIASANSGNHTITLFFQGETGFPDPPIVLGGPGVTDSPQALDVADLDLDGRLDLVSANRGSSNLAVFLQSAPWASRESPDIVIGQPGTTDSPGSVVATDVDGDGQTDIVSANETGQNLAVFFRSSDGSYDQDPLRVGNANFSEAPQAVAAADLNRDGLPDLISVNEGPDNLTVFFQVEKRNFEPIPLNLGGVELTNSPRALDVADIDGDGAVDLVTANFASNNLTVFQQTKRNRISTQPDLRLGEDSIDPVAVEVADMDSDGDLDLVVANAQLDGRLGGNNIAIFLQDSPRQVSTVPRFVLEAQGLLDFPVDISLGDLNGDTLVDIISANSRSNNLTFSLQLTSGGFTDPSAIGGPGLTPQPQDVEVVDLNNDGRLDVVCANLGGLAIFHQSGPGTFPIRPSLVLGPDELFSAISVDDLNRDGLPDLIVADAGQDDIKVYYQTEIGFSDPPRRIGQSGARQLPSFVVVEDLNGDDRPDIVTTNLASEMIRVFLQEHDGSFSLVEVGEGFLGDPRRVVIADIDHDGHLDLASANSGSDNITVFFQRTLGRFLPEPDLTFVDGTMDVRALTTADLDGDGDLDIVAASETSKISVYFGGR